jgi:Fic family protein
MAERHSGYQPPFQLSHGMAAHIAAIAELLGTWKAANPGALKPELRRGHRLRTLHASLAIEQNTLTLEQVTAVLDGKIVLGAPREIQEVRNANAAYDAMEQWHPHRLDDLLAAHGLMMQALVDDAGCLRSGGVGIYRGEALVHMAPPPSRVPALVQDLLHWLERTEAHPLVASAAFHYEFEFIHPFSDGNGRMGRLWQTLILSRWQPMLAWLPVETVIKRRQDDYYAQLAESDQRGDCSGFIEFMLAAITDSLREAISVEMSAKTPVETLVKTPVETLVKTPEAILAVLNTQPTLTLAEVASVLGKSTSSVERAARKLREQGRLRFVGPKKGGRWEVVP